MTKREYAECLVASPVWDGERNINWLVRNYTKEELKDAFDMMEEYENDYYEYRYGY